MRLFLKRMVASSLILLSFLFVFINNNEVQAVVKATDCSFELKETKLIYNGKVRKPIVIVKNQNGILLKQNYDYTVSYDTSKKIGSYKLKVKLKGKYSGSKTLSYQIVPKNVSNLKFKQTVKKVKVHQSEADKYPSFSAIWGSDYVYVEKESNEIKLSWKKISGVSGYKVYVYKKGKWTSLATTKKTSYTVKKLTAGKSCKYAIKAYKSVNGKKFYSPKYISITAGLRPKETKLNLKIKNNKAYLSWDKVNCSGYFLYITCGNDKCKKIDINDKNTQSYTFKYPGYAYDISVKIKSYVQTDNGKVFSNSVSKNSRKESTLTPYAKTTSGKLKIKPTTSKEGKKLFKKWLLDRGYEYSFEATTPYGKRKVVYYCVDNKWTGVDSRGVVYDTYGKPKKCKGCEKYQGFVDSKIACDGWDCYKFLSSY